MEWYKESREQRDVFIADYVKLYVEVVVPAIRAADADGRPVVDTSPSNGLISGGQNTAGKGREASKGREAGTAAGNEMSRAHSGGDGVARPDLSPYVKRWGVTSAKRVGSNAGSFGDIHYYNYQADCEDASSYPLARFVSEHGFQAFPAFDVYKHVTSPEDWSRESRIVKLRMRHPDGDAQALAMMQRHFRVPPANATAGGSAEEGGSAAVGGGQAEQQELFATYLWLTQLQQARCYETAFAQWRRQRSAPANTMGILYWQLNAIWQGPDWSTIEYDGRLRLSHHFVKRVFADVLISTTSEEAGEGAVVDSAEEASRLMRVHVSNDHTSHGIEGTLRIRLYLWADAPARPVAEVTARVSVGPACTKAVWVGYPRLGQTGVPPSEAFVRLELQAAGDETLLASADHWLVQWKEAVLPRAAVRIVSVKKTSDRGALITVGSNRSAAFVSVECASVVGAFSDAGFALLAGETRDLSFLARGAHFELGAFVSGLRARSLRDTYV